MPNAKTISPSEIVTIATSNYPAISEIPLSANGDGRNADDMMRLMLIPRDDVELRKYAAQLLNQEEEDNNRRGGPAPGPSLFNKISNMHARTPGGVAWQIATIVATFDDSVDEGGWQWWHHLLGTALADLIDLERQRQGVPVGVDEAGREIGKIEALWLEYSALANADYPDDVPESINDRLTGLSDKIASTTAKTLRECIAKAKLLRWYENQGTVPSSNRPAGSIAHSLHDSLETLLRQSSGGAA